MNNRDDLIAAEYVLGLHLPETQGAIEARLASDDAFADAVERWRKHFGEFDASTGRIEPSPDLWKAIERNALTSRAAPNPGLPALLDGFWSNVRALRIAAVAGGAAAVAFAVLAGILLQRVQDVAARTPVYVAILLSDATKQAGAVVNAFADGRVEMVPLADIAVPDGRVLQIWTLWDRATGPRSVGLIDHARTTRLDLDRLPATGANQLFEITLEPSGGSPIGRPTGPILYKGTTSRAL